jgi:2-polyprenyl-3-methyl-5-hydroxy-6-metoxy-1,4-benzoquinol methylase
MEARRLEAEWLDELPADDPRARRSRADLRRVNALMGNARIVASALKPWLAEPPRTLVELGAGDGEFALRVARLVRAPSLDVTLVDRQRIVSSETLGGFKAARVTVDIAQDDVFEWLARDGPRFDVVMANLFLHHFEDEPLARMLALAARRARIFVACETRRSAFALAGARMLGAIGCNDVTLHDAAVSVRAGFRDGDISALWPAGASWALREEARGLFSHLFAARRLDA